MVPVIIGCVIGAALMARRAPKTRVRKLKALGSETGVTYDVEEFPDAGLVIAYGPLNSCVAVFTREPTGGFSFLRGLGQPEDLKKVCADIAPSSLGPRKEKNA